MSEPNHSRNSSVYNMAEAYDLAFSYRDIPHEVDFLLSIYNDVATYWPEERSPALLELASGPARHAMAFAKRGWHAVALDISPTMCQYGKIVSEQQNCNVSYVCDDMINFDTSEKFDLSIIMIDSVCHILNKKDLENHFRSVANSLGPNGIYIMEIAYNENGDNTTKSEWNISNDDSYIDVSWKDIFRTQDDCFLTEFNFIGRIREVDLKFSERFLRRSWARRDLEEVIKNSSIFDIINVFHDFSKKEIMKSDVWRNIFVLRKI